MAKTLDEAGVKRLIQEIKGANKNLNAPIPISTENTTESMAQNVKNIADYVEKAKAAGIANVNGMAVTCIIDNDYSAVGYLYSYNGGPILVTGIKTYDDTELPPTAFFVDEGLYNKREVVIKDLSDQVTSDMLVEGARKPIILTPSTTEVDEETYQKLLSDDVDVVFMTSTEDANLCTLTLKYDDGDAWGFTFTGFSHEGVSLSQTYLYGYDVRIIKTGNPHQCEVINNSGAIQFDSILLNEGFINKSTLSPVLQEIDLGGTDADRKAKLDQFANNWKTLTGASDLTGARFVGKFVITDDIERNVTGIMTYCVGDDTNEINDNHFYGICNGYSFSEQKSQIAVKVSCKDGSLTITPLFSHLEAITIKTGNTPENKAANAAAIKAYVDNLKALGVDTTKGYMIPICFSNTELGYVMYHPFSTGSEYTGIVTGPGGASSNIAIEKSGYAYVTTHIQSVESSSLTTTAKTIVPAINEVNANAVHNDKLVPTLEAITIKTNNTPESKAANVAAIKAYVDNLKALGVDVTKGYMIPTKLDLGIFGGFLSYHFDTADFPWSGVFIKSGGSGRFVRINKDGLVALMPDILNSGNTYTTLTTTSKGIIPAINEVNALAKGYSTIFTPIELTTETAQNKTAIDARAAAFTAQGISLTNGCCIPVTYKGVYAGNISLINGDWYGLLVKNTNNPADNINIKLSADGTITEGNSAQ